MILLLFQSCLAEYWCLRTKPVPQFRLLLILVAFGDITCFYLLRFDVCKLWILPVHKRGYHGLLLRNITVIDFMCSAVSRSEGHRNLVSAKEELQITVERPPGHWYPHCEEDGSIFVL